MSRLTVLDNGVRVVSHVMPGLETAAVGLFANAGSRHETAELNGLAHLFEHMVFKGAGDRSAREISEAI
jgi:predicted Zn-dependent peptidase